MSSLDGPICANLRANQFTDSRGSFDSRKSFQGSRTEPFFCKSHFGGLKIANRRFESRESLARYEINIGAFSLRIDSRESPRFALRIAGPSKMMSSAYVETFILATETPGPKKGFRRVFEGVLEGLSGVIRANRFARFARITRFARIGTSSDSGESGD